MNTRLPFRFLDPTFYAGLFDDPLLFIRIRPTGQSLLFDCGQMQHVAKRVLKSVTAVFVSHAHMDHFMGLDNLIRNVHVSPRVVEIYGPPGIAAKTGHKFAAYDWNLAEATWGTFRVNEIHDDRISAFSLIGPDGFSCRYEGEIPRTESTIFQNDHLLVEAFPGDHRIPSLFFRITEKPVFAVDEEKLEMAGLVKGEWLLLLKKRLQMREDADKPLTVLRRVGEKVREDQASDLPSLYETIRRNQKTASIGYLSDIGYSEDTVERILPVLKGVTLLVCECSFLAKDRDKARISYHLCTTDLNDIVERVRPEFVLPMHLSKSNSEKSHLLYEELEFPSKVILLRLPDRVAPRPLLMNEAIGLTRPNQ